MIWVKKNQTKRMQKKIRIVISAEVKKQSYTNCLIT